MPAASLLRRSREQVEFDKFPRGPKLNVKYAGMMQYDGDALIPDKYLVNPPGIDRTVGESLASSIEALHEKHRIASRWGATLELSRQAAGASLAPQW